MNAVIGFSDMLLETPLNNVQEDYARTINSSGESLLHLLDDILDISRIEAGRLSFESEDFDPATAASELCRVMEPRLGEKDVAIHCRIDPEVPRPVKGDVGRYRQVVANLLTNAVKFTKQGEIELTLEVEEIDGDQVKLKLKVRDTGMGIDPERLETIFDEFRQADSSIYRDFGGTGLGLSICRQIARLMGGSIWAESSPGKGSTFHFNAWFERSREKETAPNYAPEDLQNQHNENISILLAEDNHINRKLANHILTKAGCKVHMVENGQEAVSAFMADPDSFDLILMDVRMPVMDGKEATRRIRAAGYDKIIIIAVTAETMKGDREKCIEAGMNDYISKPVKQETVYRMIKKYIES